MPTAGTPNMRVAIFFRSQDIEADDVRYDSRSFDFLTIRKSQTINASLSDLAGVKQLAKTQLDKLFLTSGKTRVAELAKDGFYGTKPVFEPTVLPVFYETERAFASTTIWKVTRLDDHNGTVVRESVVTTCTMLLKGKFVLLYVRGAKGDVEWTRTEAVKMPQKLAKLNPDNFVEAMNEKTGLDTQKIIDAGIKGSKLPKTWTQLWICIGGIAVVLILVGLKRWAKSEPPVIGM
jgi:hypothetical protein